MTNQLSLPNPSSSLLSSQTVFSNQRAVRPPQARLPASIATNTRQKMDGVEMMEQLYPECITAAFFDPQYRGILDKMGYGNEGVLRGQRRSALKQMDEETINTFIRHIDRLLISSGHLFLWMDKFHLCTGFSAWLGGTALETVDMITWNKGRIGMGYRTRRTSEHLIILQKKPRRAKGVWTRHDIPDVWTEDAPINGGAHPKPVGLQAALIEAVSQPGDLILDPAAGSFSVFDACKQCEGRIFIGCDLNG